MALEKTKTVSAFLTIGELADELNLPQHILRYWETRFRQLKPLQRAGNRRYYRPDDVDLARKINNLLNVEGYTVKGVQKLLSGGAASKARSLPGPRLLSLLLSAVTRRSLLRFVTGLSVRFRRMIAQVSG
jgi:DNA-binding transcriptional MerR regulator